MGLYRIPLRDEKIGVIPQLMAAIGFPVVQMEILKEGVSYKCANLRRTNKYWTFYITHEKEGDPQFFMCGLSQVSKRVVSAMNLNDFFDKEISTKNT